VNSVCTWWYTASVKVRAAGRAHVDVLRAAVADLAQLRVPQREASTPRLDDVHAPLAGKRRDVLLLMAEYVDSRAHAHTLRTLAGKNSPPCTTSTDLTLIGR
jgi:hypothetical protein